MMNLAFRFTASLSVTIDHHAVGGEGATPPSYFKIYTLSKSVIRVKNSHVFVTHVKNSNEFSTGLTNTCEFFTRLK